MSISSYSYLANLYEKKSHLRNDSDELDVFEAAQYFSDDYNDGDDHVVPRGAPSEEKIEIEEKQTSLDTPMHNSPLQNPKNDHLKNKQPTSPSRKLANLLNSLFNQTSSKKKKSISFISETLKEHADDPRSSISHFTVSNISTTTNDDSTSFNSSPTFTNTSIDQMKSNARLHGNKFGFSDRVSEENGKSGIEKVDQDDIWVDKVDDGAESDSSSDLFELQNYDLKYCCYKSANMESIKRGVQVL